MDYDIVKSMYAHVVQAETAYAKQVLADTEALQEALYRELRGSIQEADQSAPLRHATSQPLSCLHV